jgi:hypothetical protein
MNGAAACGEEDLAAVGSDEPCNGLLVLERETRPQALAVLARQAPARHRR